MSRIQEILNKAERDGTARRTRPLGDEPAPAPTGHEPTGREASDERRGRGPADAPPSATIPTMPPRRSHPATAPETPPSVEPPRHADDSPANVFLPATSSTGRDAARNHSPVPPRAVRAVRPEGARPVVPPAVVQTPSGGATVATATAQASELDAHLVAALAPTSLAAEQYRSLRTRLKRAESGRSLRAIAITSPAKGDGKSLTAANLSLTMAQEVQQRVLLVDCDLRRPSVHRLFGLGEGTGLVDVLMNAADLDQVLVWLPEHHLTVLPAGIPPSNPAELLGSATMRRTLDALRTRFDRILIDVPPVAPLADLHVLAPLVDGLLMIVRAGITPKPAIERALAGLDPAKVLGLVLNEAGGESSDTDAYAYEGYGYIAG